MLCGVIVCYLDIFRWSIFNCCTYQYSSILSVIAEHFAGGCVLQEAVAELQAEIERSQHNNEMLTAAAADYNCLLSSFTEIEAKLKTTQQKLTEQTSLV